MLGMIAVPQYWEVGSDEITWVRSTGSRTRRSRDDTRCHSPCAIGASGDCIACRREAGYSHVRWWLLLEHGAALRPYCRGGVYNSRLYWRHEGKSDV